MTILHPVEIRDMTPAERQAELENLETELLNAQAVKAAGGMPDNPGRISEMRRTIARLKTIQREEGDLQEDIDEADVAETEAVTAGLFGRRGEDDEADEDSDTEAAAVEPVEESAEAAATDADASADDDESADADDDTGGEAAAGEGT